VKPKVGIGRQDQVIDPHAFTAQLLFGAEHMRIVLGKAAYPHQPVQRAGRLIAVHVAKLGQPDRQLTI
jgi:hypothetical protein